MCSVHTLCILPSPSPTANVKVLQACQWWKWKWILVVELLVGKNFQPNKMKLPSIFHTPLLFLTEGRLFHALKPLYMAKCRLCKQTALQIKPINKTIHKQKKAAPVSPPPQPNNKSLRHGWSFSTFAESELAWISSPSCEYEAFI